MMVQKQMNLASSSKKTKSATQKQVMLDVWKTMPVGEFDVYDYFHRVDARLSAEGTGISGSGHSAMMRRLRGEYRNSYHIHDDRRLLNGDVLEHSFNYSYDRSLDIYTKLS